MSGYRPYLHVERLDSPACEGLLQNDMIVVTAKLDGTSACVYWDADLEQVGAGSRKRALTEMKDNAEFYAFTGSKIMIDQALHDFGPEDLPAPTVISQVRGKDGKLYTKFT
mgnify:CR=1 FL=1